MNECMDCLSVNCCWTLFCWMDRLFISNGDVVLLEFDGLDIELSLESSLSLNLSRLSLCYKLDVWCVRVVYVKFDYSEVSLRPHASLLIVDHLTLSWMMWLIQLWLVGSQTVDSRYFRCCWRLWFVRIPATKFACASAYQECSYNSISTSLPNFFGSYVFLLIDHWRARHSLGRHWRHSELKFVNFKNLFLTFNCSFSSSSVTL